MLYNGEAYEALFSVEHTALLGGGLSQKGVKGYRVKTIISGRQVECEITPIWKNKTTASAARKATTGNNTREAQRRVNMRNAQKQMTRLAHANFTADDISVTLTYKGNNPPDAAQARRDIANFIRRARAWRRSHDLSELKYICVLEYEETPDSRKRIHHHIIMSGMNRDVVERLWDKGRANADRLQPDRFGLEALTRYMLKSPKGSKKWTCSKNLTKPIVTVADHKLTRRQITRVADDMENNAPAIFAKAYPKYEFLDCEVKFSDFVPGAYVYARMRNIIQPGKKGIDKHAPEVPK